MLKGHGTLKTLLGRSVVPSKRRRDDFNQDARAQPDTSNRHLSGDQHENNNPVDVAGDCSKIRCPICGDSLDDEEDPNGHAGPSRSTQFYIQKLDLHLIS
jgi:hypothetical protein